MDGTVGIVAEQIVVMFMVLAVGFALYRVKFLTDEGAAQMSDLVLYVANPALIAQALMREFDVRVLIGAAWTALFAAVVLAIAAALGAVAYRDGVAHWQIGRFSVAFSNAGFIGIPLAYATLGADAVFYISVANAVQTALIWSWGVWLASGDKRECSPQKVVTNPAIIAMAIGLVCFLTTWRPPELVTQALDDLANMNTGLVMLVLGAHLGKCSVGELLRSAELYKVSLHRLVTMPLLTTAMLLGAKCLLGSETPDSGVFLAMVMYQGMPIAAVASLFAHKYERDGDFGAGAVALSTLLSLVTLPCVMGVATALLDA